MKSKSPLNQEIGQPPRDKCPVCGGVVAAFSDRLKDYDRHFYWHSLEEMATRLRPHSGLNNGSDSQEAHDAK